MSNFFRWLADVGPTLGRRSKSRWADVGSHHRADGCADVGPTLARRQHAIWVMAAKSLGVNDYCNSLVRSLTALDLCKLQCVQNSLARIVTNTTKYSHITPVRTTLHWLFIEHCSIFKTALMV